MKTENLDKSAPLVLAASLLSVAVSAYHDNHDPGHASPEDVAGVIHAAREGLQAALPDYESQDGSIFRAIDVLVLAEAYVVTDACRAAGRLGESPIRGALEVAGALLERELESKPREPTASGGAPAELSEAA